MRRRNVDYDEHRADDVDLGPPALVPLPPGTFFTTMKRLGRIGGQHKVPQLGNDRRFAEALLESRSGLTQIAATKNPPHRGSLSSA